MLIHDADITGSFLYNGVNISNVTGSAASLTALNQFSASINLFTGSYNTGSFTGSFIGNGSGLNGVVSASFASTATSASQASNANTATSASQASNAISSSYAANADLLDGIDSTRFAVTSSNTFTGTQYVSSANNATSFTSTASIYTDGGLRVTKDAYVSGTIYVNNLTVYGTQSINYITSSQLNIGTNIITVNTDVPAIRFGGLAVYDSGSTRLTGSLLWDSEDNHWVYSNPSGSSYDGGMMISGPRNSSGLGNEQGTINNAVMKGQGGDHITSSLITENGTATTFYTNALYVSSSNRVGINTTAPSYSLDINNVGGSSATERLYGNDQANVRLRLENIGSSGRTWKIVGGLPGANNSNFSIYDVTATATRFNIDNTGAATFASTIAAGGQLALTSGFGTSTAAISIYNNTASSASNIAQIDFRLNNTFGGNERVASITALNPNASGNNGGALVFSVSANGTATTPTEDMRITQAGRLLIGQTSETTTDRVQITGNARTLGYFYSTDGTRELYLNPAADFGNGSLPAVQVATNHALQFATNNALRLTIASGGAATFLGIVNGNVGVNVGTNALGTDRMFQVSGTAFTSGTTQFGIVNNPTMSTPTTIYAYYGGVNVTSATNAYGMYITGAGGTITNKWGIYQEGANDRNYFAGNVGINATSPAAKLHVASGNIMLSDTTGGGSSVGKIIYKQTNSSGFDIAEISGIAGATVVEGILAFNTKDSGGTMAERMRITSSGNIGIGSTSPGSYRLQVISSADGVQITSAGSSQALNLVSSTNNQTILRMNNFNNNFYDIQNNASDNSFVIDYNDSERMRIVSGGGVEINNTLAIGRTTESGVRLSITATTADFNGYAIIIRNSTPADLFVVRNDGLYITGTRAASPYNNTTGAGANMVVASDGILYRSTSSIKYKTNVQNYTKGLTEIMQLRAVTYEGKSTADEGKIFAGLIAEEVHDLGLTEFVQYAEDGTPDALSYQNMIALAIKAIQEQQAQIDELKTLLNNK